MMPTSVLMSFGMYKQAKALYFNLETSNTWNYKKSWEENVSKMYVLHRSALPTQPMVRQILQFDCDGGGNGDGNSDSDSSSHGHGHCIESGSS